MPANNVQGLDDGGGPQAWFQSLPLVTKYWFGGALITTCAGNVFCISNFVKAVVITCAAHQVVKRAPAMKSVLVKRDSVAITICYNHD